MSDSAMSLRPQILVRDARKAYDTGDIFFITLSELVS